MMYLCYRLFPVGLFPCARGAACVRTFGEAVGGRLFSATRCQGRMADFERFRPRSRKRPASTSRSSTRCSSMSRTRASTAVCWWCGTATWSTSGTSAGATARLCQSWRRAARPSRAWRWESCYMRKRRRFRTGWTRRFSLRSICRRIFPVGVFAEGGNLTGAGAGDVGGSHAQFAVGARGRRRCSGDRKLTRSHLPLP